ncbi:unnamed protein product [Caretta caretta]
MGIVQKRIGECFLPHVKGLAITSQAQNYQPWRGGIHLSEEPEEQVEHLFFVPCDTQCHRDLKGRCDTKLERSEKQNKPRIIEGSLEHFLSSLPFWIYHLKVQYCRCPPQEAAGW